MANTRYVEPNGTSGRFPGYTGGKIFEVTHPARKKPVKVYAPDETGAILTAADVWGERWTDYAFYSNCTVLKA